MIAGTLFSGIGAPECAAPHFDWRWAAEIDPFASAVHAARFPGTPNLGDVNRIDPDATEPVDLIVFGSPCQSFSVAGRRLGLDDPRGNLALVALRLIGRIRPRWMVFENVPGLLSSDGGRDFGAFLGLLGELGYGFAYRILDAQHAGVPQRRRRAFVVGHLGDWRPAAAVLFEPESLRGDTAPRREAGKAAPAKSLCGSDGGIDREDRHTLIPNVADPISCSENRTYTDEGTTFRGHNLIPDVAWALQERDYKGADSDTKEGHLIVADIRNGTAGDVAMSLQGGGMGEDRGLCQNAIPHVVAFQERTRTNGRNIETQDDLAYSLTAPKGGGRRQEMNVAAPVAFHENQRGETWRRSATNSLNSGGGKPGQGYPAAMTGMSVRRLLPVECEKLQGFPPGWTDITYRGKPAADRNRYRALGNSMAVPVIGWVLDRIREFEESR